MVRSAAVGTEPSKTAFVKWEEVFSTNDRGRREVRYYLKRRDGTSDLAVVGKEKKLGHNTTSSHRYRYAIREKTLLPVLSSFSIDFPSKLRSRRDVIDLLSSVLSDGSSPLPPQHVDRFLEAGDTLRLNLGKLEDVRKCRMGQHAAEFLWVGSAWTCRKRRTHYEAYIRNGVRISVHDFVYVLAEEGNRLVAYLDDMYEDPRGNRMVVVRWFHKVDEVGLDLPHRYKDREILFSLCHQDLSIECIDGLATVLSPLHYEDILKADAHTKLEPFVCRNQFNNEDVKPFDITQVKGYWKQEIHRYISSTTLKGCPRLQTLNDDAKDVMNHSSAVGIRPRKRLRRLKDTDMDAKPLSKIDAQENSDLNGHLAEGSLNECAFVQKNLQTIGSQIEVLSQDSGIRGCWFKAVIIKKHKNKLKVRYQDVKDAADESVNLEEWISSTRLAASDQLGIRISGRMTIRPTRLSNNFNDSLTNVGSIVDAWMHEGWWEGIVVHKESKDRIHVYFPGEKKQSVFGCKDLRFSEEWLGDRWKQMKGRPDIVSSISFATETNSKLTKSHDVTLDLAGKSHDKELISGHNSLGKCVADRDFEVVGNHVKRDLLAHLNWNWSTKKRHYRNSFQRSKLDASNHNNLEVVKARKHDTFLKPSLLKVDHDNCKVIRDPSLFCPTTVSPITSLVMSR